MPLELLLRPDKFTSSCCCLNNFTQLGVEHRQRQMGQHRDPCASVSASVSVSAFVSISASHMAARGRWRFEWEIEIEFLHNLPLRYVGSGIEGTRDKSTRKWTGRDNCKISITLCGVKIERKVLGCRFRYHWLLGGQKSLNHFWTGLRGVLQSEVEWRRVGCVYPRRHVRIGIIMHLRWSPRGWEIYRDRCGGRQHTVDVEVEVEVGVAGGVGRRTRANRGCLRAVGLSVWSERQTKAAQDVETHVTFMAATGWRWSRFPSSRYIFYKLRHFWHKCWQLQGKQFHLPRRRNRGSAGWNCNMLQVRLVHEPKCMHSEQIGTK